MIQVEAEHLAAVAHVDAIAADDRVAERNSTWAGGQVSQISRDGFGPGRAGSASDKASDHELGLIAADRQRMLTNRGR